MSSLDRRARRRPRRLRLGRLGEHLDAGTAATLRRAFEATRSPRKKGAEALAGPARLEQDWERLWSRWHEHVLRFGEEEGTALLILD